MLFVLVEVEPELSVAVLSVAVGPAGAMPEPVAELFDRAPAAWAWATPAPPASARAINKEETRNAVMRELLG